MSEITLKGKETAFGSFTIERVYDAELERVYTAWTDPEIKARWFVGPSDKWKLHHREDNFVVGGGEILAGEFPGIFRSRYVSRYHLIQPNVRVVYDYEMVIDDIFHSVSLATMQLDAVEAGTRLTYTEQITFVDGTDGEKGTKQRRNGVGLHLGQLADELARM